MFYMWLHPLLIFFISIFHCMWCSFTPKIHFQFFSVSIVCGVILHPLIIHITSIFQSVYGVMIHFHSSVFQFVRGAIIHQ